MSTWRVGTLNVDFGRGATAVKRDVLAALGKCDVVCLQETKNVNLRKLLPSRYGVHQVRSSKAQAGSAIVWHKARVTAGRRNITLMVAGVPGLLTRWSTQQVFKWRRVRVRVRSIHQIPMRSWRARPGKYATYAGRIRRWANRSHRRGRYAVVGGDFNKLVHGDPMNLTPAGLRTRGTRIDGVAYTRSLDAGRPAATYPHIGPKGHPLVVVTLRIPKPGERP